MKLVDLVPGDVLEFKPELYKRPRGEMVLSAVLDKNMLVITTLLMWGAWPNPSSIMVAGNIGRRYVRDSKLELNDNVHVWHRDGER